jgi:S-adenosylmethionine uptake transporter
VAALSIMDAVMKHLVLAIGLVAVSVSRSAVTLLLSTALYLPRRQSWPDKRTLRIHLVRSTLVMAMGGLFFWGIGRVPLAQALAVTFIAPLIALLLAALTLHERIGANSIAGSVAAFAGVIVIVVGQARAHAANAVLLGLAAIIVSALCYAANIVLMRHQALAARPLEINFFQAAIVMALWLVLTLVVGVPHWPAGQWTWIVVAALLSTSGTLLFAWGYARGPASYLVVTEYSGFLWAALMGWLVFHERVSSYTLAGTVLIVAGCLVAARGRPPTLPEIDIAA